MTLRAEDLERAFGELTSRFRGYAEAPDAGERAGRAGRAGRPGAGQAAGARDRRPVAGGPAAGPAGPGQPAAGPAFRVHRPARHRQDHGRAHPGAHLRRARPAGPAGGGRGAPGRPGGRAPRLDRDQDRQADRLRARRGPVHRRGVLAVQRGLLRRRRLRVRGRGDAAQAGRGRPGPAGDRARRVPRGHGPLPAQQSGAGLAVLGPHLVPQLHPGRAGPDHGRHRGAGGRLVRPGRAARA